jgi:hypothetical protein
MTAPDRLPAGTPVTWCCPLHGYMRTGRVRDDDGRIVLVSVDGYPADNPANCWLHRASVTPT